VTGPPGDLWPELPADIRAAGREVARQAWRGVFDGVPGASAAWRATRPLFMSRGHLDELGDVAARLARLVLDACRRRARTAGDLAAVLGTRHDDLPLLDRAAPLTDDLLISMRPDVIYSGRVPKFVELNIEGGVGGTLQVDVLAGRFMAAYSRALAAQARASQARASPARASQARGGHGTLAAPAPSVAARFTAIREAFGEAAGGLRVAIPVFGVGIVPGLRDPDRFIAWLGPMCEGGRALGFDTLACRLDRMTLDDRGRLCAGGGPVDLAIRLFLFSAQPPSAGTDAFATAVRAGTVAMHTPEVTCLLMDKRTLAWLWADIGRLDGADQELIRRHVPWTAYLPDRTPADDPLAQRARSGRTGLVLKPADGHGGADVTIGPAVSEPVWRDAVRRAAGRGGYVVQEYTAPDLTEIEFAHTETGERRTAAVPFAVGPLMFGLRPSGVLVRHGAPEADGGVLNLNFGALPNTVLLVGRPC
jgi:hypothetical protein